MNLEHITKNIENLSLLEIDLSSSENSQQTSLNIILLTLAGVTGFNINLIDIDTVLSSIQKTRKLSMQWDRPFNDPYLKINFALDKNFQLKDKHLNKIKSEIQQALSKKVNIIEVSPLDVDDEVLKEIFNFIDEVSEDQFISIHTHRIFQSNAHLVNRTKDAFNQFGQRLLLNVDGATQTNNLDTYDQTIQTIATADILIKDLKVKEKRKYKNLPVYLSGDINKKTTGLAKLCGIDYCGLSVDIDRILSLQGFNQNEGIEKFSNIERQLSLLVEELEYFKNLDRKKEE